MDGRGRDGNGATGAPSPRQAGGTAAERGGRIGPGARLRLALLVLYDFLRVRIGLRTGRLPELVDHLRGPARLRHAELEPRRLGRIVDRVLDLGPLDPPCIVRALVLFRMLRRQGTAAVLAIGLPPSPTTPDAHAWVEVAGDVVGPPPGRLGHTAMARYGGGRRDAP